MRGLAGPQLSELASPSSSPKYHPPAKTLPFRAFPHCKSGAVDCISGPGVIVYPVNFPFEAHSLSYCRLPRAACTVTGDQVPRGERHRAGVVSPWVAIDRQVATRRACVGTRELGDEQRSGALAKARPSEIVV